MAEVTIYMDSSDKLLSLYMDNQELESFLGFTQPQNISDAFDHEENRYFFRLFKEHISSFSYKKEVEDEQV